MAEQDMPNRITDVNLTSQMKNSFLDYAMSVIVSRALPDVRDGLKPVQRRILYGMNELGVTPDKPYKKSARIVGDVMGKFHPHGDSSIYEGLVRMAQDFSYRYMLVDGHGNFGSVDGDGAAAMRYTEAKMSKIAVEMLRDINKDTVNFHDNYDGTEKEPDVLPARFPNLLVNGASGIAVGMATNIPTHNLGEVINGIHMLMDNPDITTEGLMKAIPGPDFPTGGVVMGKSGIRKAYETGRGTIIVRAKVDIEEQKNGKQRIIVHEIPYMVNKAKLIEKISELHRDKKIDGITDLRDETSREGMRVCIELRRDVNPNIVLNQLYKHTQLQDTFGVIMLALVNNEPVVMNILQMLKFYLKHQEEVVTRRTKYELNKAEERAHILEGLLIALDNIDNIISIIRSSKNTPEAKEKLIEKFSLTDAQAQAIVDMRLRALTGLEREKIENEYAELKKKIAEYKRILSDRNVLLDVVKKEIIIIRDQYGDDRRTLVGYDEYDISIEDLVTKQNTIITMTKLGYIKRMSVDNFKSQHRGGKGIKGMQTIDDDYIERMVMTTTHHDILFFTNTGRSYRIKAYEIPESGRTARGTAIINLIQLMPNEKITAMITMSGFDDETYLFMATKKGIVKKTFVSEYRNIRKSGLQAINLKDDDELIEVKVTNDTQDIIMVTRHGHCIKFNEKDVRATGRASMGVIGMNLSYDDEIVAMQLSSQGEYLLFVSEFGMGKRTETSEFPVQRRGGKGIKCYKITGKTGNVVAAKAINEDNEVMIINTEGIIIQLMVREVSILGRITSGVKLIDMDSKKKDIVVASMTRVRDTIPEEGEEPAKETV